MNDEESRMGVGAGRDRKEVEEGVSSCDMTDLPPRVRAHQFLSWVADMFFLPF